MGDRGAAALSRPARPSRSRTSRRATPASSWPKCSPHRTERGRPGARPSARRCCSGVLCRHADTGRTSWRLSEQDGGDLYLALLARDAGGLEVPPTPDMPPPVTTAIDRLPVAPSPVAAVQWVTWWRGLVSFQADEASPSRRPGPEDDVHAWLDSMRERHMAVFD